MGKIRAERGCPFSWVSNTLMWDKRLTPKARFIHIFCLNLADSWEYNVNGLATCIGISKDSITKGLQELEKYGYLKRVQLFDESKRFAGYDYIFIENPDDNRTSDLPYTENQDTVKSYTAKPTQLNNKELKTKELKNKEVVVSNTEKKSENTSTTTEYSPISDVQHMLAWLPSQGQAEMLISIYQETGEAAFHKALIRAAKANAKNVSFIEKAAIGIASGDDYEEKQEEPKQEERPLSPGQQKIYDKLEAEMKARKNGN